ncbi:MAG: cation diffusion facilitator family transporter, partial [Coriobacteriales bacterium]
MEQVTKTYRGAERVRAIKHVLYLMVVFNVAVAAAKIIYGSITSSMAMQADGIDSLFDGMGSLIGIVGMVLASRPPDQDHPYGHAKFETYASLAIGVILFIGAYRIASEAIANLINGTAAVTVTPLSYIVMAATITANLLVTIYENKMSKRYGSEILGADAKHTLTDVIVSCSVILGLVLAQMGFEIADSIITLVVSAGIVVTAWNVFRQGNKTLS